MYLDVVIVYGREYQRYSIERRIYFGPIDDVKSPRLRTFSVSLTHSVSRKKRIASNFSIAFSVWSSITG